MTPELEAQTIEMLERVAANLSLPMTGHRADELKREVNALLIELDHTPPQLAGFMSLRQAADSLGVSADTLRHQAQAGVLRAALFGKTYVVLDSEVERYRRTSLGRRGRAAAKA